MDSSLFGALQRVPRAAIAGMLAALTLAFLGLSVAYAEDAAEEADTFREKQDAVREAVEARVASQTEAIREQVEERREALDGRLRDRIANLLTNMVRRMNAAIDRLSNIADRMETRVEKLGERGIDASAALPFIDAARDELASAEALIHDDLKATIEEVIGSDEPGVRMAPLRADLSSTASHIRQAREELRGALAAMKDAVLGSSTGTGASDATANESGDADGETLE